MQQTIVIVGVTGEMGSCFATNFAIAMHYGIGDLSKHPRLNRWFQTIQDSNIYVKTAPANFLN